MVTLRVSESVALDMLSILEVKQTHDLDVAQELKMLREDLAALDLDKIQSTKEYIALKEANTLVWQTVEWAKKDRIKASVVAEVNQVRYFAKWRLQNALWPDKPFLEHKTIHEFNTCST